MTVVAMATDAEGMFRPLSGVLQTLCCASWQCVVVAFGAVQIMCGIFNIGLGPGRTSTHPDDLTDVGAPYWLGAGFMVAGLVSIFAVWRPYFFLVWLAVTMNIVGAIFSIMAIVLYGIDLGNSSLTWMCGDTGHINCEYMAYLAQRLLEGMDISLIILAVLQLCVCISFSVLGISALIGSEKEKDVTDVQIIRPLLKEVLTTSPGA